MNMYLFIYIIAILLAITIGFFYFRSEKKKIDERRHLYSSTIHHHYISQQTLDHFIKATNNCKKNNSPISNIPINDLIIEGATILQKEAFIINDSILERCDYHVM